MASVPIELIPDDEIAELPAPEFCLEGILPEEGIGVMSGPPASGKTFVALDWAFSIATGTAWQQHEVKRGSAIYIIGEGIEGIGIRAKAWKQSRLHQGRAGVWFMRRALSLLEPGDVAQFINATSELSPRFVVIDTLARCIVGAEEDSAKDMGRIVAAVDHVRRELKTFVLLLHHPTKRGNGERGSGALAGAVHTLIRVKRNGAKLTLHCEKQKDAKPFEDITVDLRAISIDGDAESCVIGSADEQRTIDTIPVMNLRKHGPALSALVESGTPLSLRDWRERTKPVGGKPISERDFQRIANELLERDVVDQPQGRKGPYAATDDGIAAVNQARPAKPDPELPLPANRQVTAKAVPTLTAAIAAPLKGGQVAVEGGATRSADR